MAFCPLHVHLRNDQLNGLVWVWIWGDYGFHSVFVTILDAQGEVIESDYAIKDEGLLNTWAYIFEFEDEDDCSLTVQAMTMDYLGGLRIQTETVPVVQGKACHTLLKTNRSWETDALER